MSDYTNSPTLPADSGIVGSEKAFSDALTQDLTDEEIQNTLRLVLQIRQKWQGRFRSKFNDIQNFTVDDALKMVSEFETELSHTLAERANVLVTVDATPIFYGQPLVIDYQGVLSGHTLSKHGMDHEKKTAEVQRAKELGEDFLGQKNG